MTTSKKAINKPATPRRQRHLLESLEPRTLLAVINAATSAAFTAALNSAQLGDTIVLDAGTTYTGWFVLPNKTSGSGWITIQSSAMNSLPAEGVRVTPADAVNMPKIVSAGSNVAAIRTAASAHHYKLVGLEIIGPANNNDLWQLVELGTVGPEQSTLASVPHHLVIDRSIIRANSQTQQLARGIGLNSAATDIINSHISGFKWLGADSQAICGWNGPGPYNIINNYLEGAGENVMFGGADPSIPNLVPSDIVVRGNHFYKPLSWKIGHPTYAGKAWVVKNIFELKSARRVQIEGNIFENNWVHGQPGYAIVLTPRNQDGGAPWSVVEDVDFTNNIVRHSAGGFNILGYDYNHPSQQTRRIRIENNLFEDIGGPQWGTSKLFQILDRVADLTIRHNTAFQVGNIITADGGASTGFVYTDNLTPHGEYGVIGTDKGIGNSTLNHFFPGAVFTKNVIMGGPSSLYNQYPGNYFPSSWSTVQFVNQAGGNYRLLSTSPYSKVGTDNRDIGADIDQLDGAVQGALSGARPFAAKFAGHLIVNFDGAGAPITLATSGANITATKGAVTLGFSGITNIVAYDSISAETLLVDAPLTPPLRVALSAGDDVLQVNSGMLNIASDMGNYLQTLEVKVLSGATVSFAASQRLRKLDVDGVAAVSVGGAKVLLTRGLEVSGQLDLAANGLVLDYDGASPIGTWTGSSYNGVTGLLASGRNGGAWNGAGIVTSMPAATSPSALTTLGIAEASAVLGATGGMWNGLRVDGTALLVKYTCLGDANLSGGIDGDDYFAIDAGFSAGDKGFARGDFDYGGGVDADDYFAIDSNYGRATLMLAIGVAGTIPAQPLDEEFLLDELR